VLYPVCAAQFFTLASPRETGKEAMKEETGARGCGLWPGCCGGAGAGLESETARESNKHSLIPCGDDHTDHSLTVTGTGRKQAGPAGGAI